MRSQAHQIIQKMGKESAYNHHTILYFIILVRQLATMKNKIETIFKSFASKATQRINNLRQWRLAEF